MTQAAAAVVSRPVSAEPLLIGKVVSDKYKVLALIATGGMGRIYRAEQIPLGRVVALKTLISAAIRKPDSQPSTPSGTQFKQRFFREASVLSKLQHPNVVTVFDYGKIDGVPGSDDEYYMAMEFLDGETLLDRLTARGRFSASEVADYVRQAALGLRAAHALGVVHRDLKPSNLMLVRAADGEEILKILDFGIIKLLNEDTQDLTQEGGFVGSPRYMAPEQIVASVVDARADVYSLGVIAYQLLTGQTPFNGDTAVQTMMAHVNQPVPPMRSVCKDLDVSEWLEQLVEQCLEKDPAARPSSMDEVLDTLRGELGAGRMSVSMRIERGSGGARRAARSGHSRAESVVTIAESAGSNGAPAATTKGYRAKRFKRRVAIFLALAGAALVAAFFVRRAHNAGPANGSRASAAALPAEAFDMLIDSTPAGAVVRDNGQTLGSTPLHLSINNSSVRDRQRSFSLELAGYQSYVVTQGPSNGAVIVRPVLQANAPPSSTGTSAPSSAVVRRRGAPQRPPTSGTTTPPPSPPPRPRPLDIETTR